jgi:vanillate/3-O-methylgallate O-demethylase
LARFDLGQAKHVIACNSGGMIIGEGVLMRHAQDEFEFQALGPVSTWLEYNLEKGNYAAAGVNRIGKFKFQVSGPKSIFLLERLAGRSLRDIQFMHQQTIAFDGCHVTFLRQGMAGEIGFEIQGPKEASKLMVRAILEAGRDFGVRRLGARTAMINHLEACFPTVTHDYIPAICENGETDFFAWQLAREKSLGANGRMWTVEGCLKVSGSFEADRIGAWYRSPVELGWGRNIKFDHDFYGRHALEKEKANPRRKIVTLVWNADDCMDVQNSLYRGDEQPYEFMDMPRQPFFCMNAHKVVSGGRLVGVATSRGFSYYFRKMLSHCTIDLSHGEPGTEVEVVWGEPGSRQKIIRAAVAPSPFKQDRRRAEMSALPGAFAN